MVQEAEEKEKQRQKVFLTSLIQAQLNSEPSNLSKLLPTSKFRAKILLSPFTHTHSHLGCPEGFGKEGEGLSVSIYLFLPPC